MGQEAMREKIALRQFLSKLWSKLKVFSATLYSSNHFYWPMDSYKYQSTIVQHTRQL